MREVDILATAASYSPNIIYNGNMNVFLGDISSSRKAFCISNIPSSEFNALALTTSDIMREIEFGVIYDPNLEIGRSVAAINNTANFYNLASNANYKISNLKIGDTTLTDAESSNIGKATSMSINYFEVNTTGWFNSVYKQCTGISIEEKKKKIPFDSPNDDKYKNLFNSLLSNSVSISNYPGNIGGLFFELLYLQKSSNLFYKNDGYDELSQDIQNQIDDSISKLSKFFTTTDNVVNIKGIAVLEEVETTVKNLQVNFKDNETAQDIFYKYGTVFRALSMGKLTFKDIIGIDPNNVVGLAQELSCGIAQLLYYLYLSYICTGLTQILDEPIISTIPVSITFTIVPQ